MKKVSVKVVCLLALAFCAWALTVCFTVDVSGEVSREKSSGAVVIRPSEMSIEKSSDDVESVSVEVSLSGEVDLVQPGVRASEEIGVADDEVDEDELVGVQRRVFEELQEALDRESLSGVRKAVAKFNAKAAGGGLDGRVPKCLRAKAVEALGWYGKDAAVDMFTFMADVDAEIADDACSQFEQALLDDSMSQSERAELLTAALKALTDSDAIDRILSNLNDFPNSLKADTIASILESGSEAAKAVMREQIEVYLESDVASLDDIERWKAENPDED